MFENEIYEVEQTDFVKGRKIRFYMPLYNYLYFSERVSNLRIVGGPLNAEGQAKFEEHLQSILSTRYINNREYCRD